MRTIRDCNVAVIGGAGFLGSHLVNHLIEDRGCKVSVYDNLCAGRREFVHKDATFIYCDITKSEGFLSRSFKQQGVQFVFNYAAWPYIPDSFQRPLHVFEVNATGAMNVIDAAQEAGVEAILQVSSAEIYGNGQLRHLSHKHDKGLTTVHSINEDASVIPHSTYGVAKAAIDYYVQARWREAKIPCIALRQFNCVGERETHPYIVPEIISQLSQPFRQVAPGLSVSQKLTVPTVRLGNNSFRDFLYAGDAVRVAVELLERGQFGEVYNLGSETGIKMYDLAKLIGKAMGFAEVKVERDEERVRPWEIWHLQSDNMKIRNVVNESWFSNPTKQVLSTPMNNLVLLDESLRRTIKWYESNGRKWAWE